MSSAVPVVWLNLDPTSIRRGFWDQGMLERLFAGDLGRVRYEFEHHEVAYAEEMPALPGAVVVLAGGYHRDRVEEVNELIARLAWVLLFVTSDEESLFPVEQLRHARLIAWVEPDMARTYREDVRFLGMQCRADTAELLRPHERWMADRPTTLFFAGQITHPRRERMYAALRECRSAGIASDLTFTDGFAEGLPRAEYLERMAGALVAPCPSGPAIVDSFRLWEALEAGCLPAADARKDGSREGYWHWVFGDDVPFPILDSWELIREIADRPREQLRAQAREVQAWWQRWKQDWTARVEADIETLSGQPPGSELADLITVVVPTSPIKRHPSLLVLDETLDSVQTMLPGCRVVVAADGVRPEQETLAGGYADYLSAMLASFNLRRRDIRPVLAPAWGHQANLTRLALEHVRTPLILFVEHDCPLLGDIPFEQMAAVITAGEANLIRLSHEANVLEPHRYLMLDEEPRDIMGVPLTATIQWSQRPHLASAAFYRHLLRRYFGRESRTMIEDVMHGVVQRAHIDGGWGMFRLFLYTPAGDIKRSTTTDGRGEEPKYEMVMEYDEEQPEWAPRSTSGRQADAEAAAKQQPGVGG